MWIVFILLSLASMLAVFSSAQRLIYLSADLNILFVLIKHGLILFLGFVIVYFLHHVEYMRFQSFSTVIFGISVILLLFTWFFGVEINDARRWIKMPLIGISIQPSDIAKIGLVLFLSKMLSERQEVIKSFKHGFLWPLVPILVVCVLIAPSDLSTAAIIFVNCFVLLFIGRVKLTYLIMLILAGVLMMASIFGLGKVFPDKIRSATWESRIESFISGESQSSDNLHAKIAIAKGGWFGEGVGNSIQRNRIAYPYADFIYAIICEEYGLLGGGLVILAYLVLLYRVVILATKTRKLFASLAAIGLTLLIVLQAFGNIAVSLHLVPPTGLTLPLISLGGSSLIFTCVAFGILLSITHFVNVDRMKAYGQEFDIADA